MNAILNHLWQSTIFAAVILLLTLLLKRNSARLRYWLWLAASVKFLIPFSLLVAVGTTIEVPPVTPSASPVIAERLSVSFAPAATMHTPVHSEFDWPRTFTLIWLCGAMFLVWRWSTRWNRLRSLALHATPLPIDLPIPVHIANATIEPGLFGLFRPVLLLPSGLLDQLTPAQRDAIFAHELCHARNFDNLTAAVHMAVEALFWFHPLVWWIGARLVEERERACDQSVLHTGGTPEAYAEGIVSVCRNHLESPLLCASGVTGADLHRRIVEIMTGHYPLPVSSAHKAAIAAASTLLLALPVLIGFLDTPRLRGQVPPGTPLRFEVASIRPSTRETNSTNINTSNSRLSTRNTTLHNLIEFAYGVRDYQIIDAPSWIKEARYDIVATFDTVEDGAIPVTRQKDLETRNGRIRARLRALLAERFQLKVREDIRQLPVYLLTTDKKGLKITAAPNGKGNMSVSRNNGSGTMKGDGISMPSLAESLSSTLGRPVIDRTELEGPYAFEMRWSDGEDADAGPTLFTAIREQMGLHLDSGKGPVTTYIIERIERPSEN